MQYFREKFNTIENKSDAILTSYDLQAGSYIKQLSDNHLYHINGVPLEMKGCDFLTKFAQYLAKEIKQFEHKSIMEAGVGEATTLAYLMQCSDLNDCEFYGFDLAPSRILHGKAFLESRNLQAELFTGNMLSIPHQDSAFDIVYTVHAIEPNTNLAESILQELYRITNQYLILIEPSFELGNNETKANINKHAYIKNLKGTVEKLGYKITKYELCPLGSYANQPAIMIIEKKDGKLSSTDFACPICHSQKSFSKDNEGYYCDGCFMFFPIVRGVPILTKEAGVLFTQYKTEINY